MIRIITQAVATALRLGAITPAQVDEDAPTEEVTPGLHMGPVFDITPHDTTPALLERRRWH